MLSVLQAPDRDDVAPRVTEFLQGLPGPVAIHLPGEDAHRSRVLVTLSHGNEPSGLEALHQWLLSGQKCAVTPSTAPLPKRSGVFDDCTAWP